jgi:penicillin amidase
MSRICWLALAAFALLPAPGRASAREPQRLSGLHRPAAIIRDGADIAHVRAADEHDLFFLEGWLHAQDRLFQLDTARRQASGTLAELLGPSALPGDVQLRTLGLRRAAERSLPLLAPSTVAALEAYAEGVNAWATSRPLPPEYAALELTRFEPWTALDSVVVGKLIAFGLAFDLGDVDRTVALQSYAAAFGPDPGGALFAEDLFRAAPFDRASTLPDARRLTPPLPRPAPARGTTWLHPRTVQLAADWLRQARAHPLLRRLVNRDDRGGSNQWVVAGRLTTSGSPLLANDPHLDLLAPSTFYPVHLEVQAGPPGAGLDVIGNSFPGAPGVIIGHNRRLAWGATYHPFDVTDVFQEQLRADPASPSGLSTLHDGRLEPVLPIPEAYRVNVVGDGVPDDVVAAPPDPAIPPYTLIVPRRNGGPLVQVDTAAGVGLSVAFTGFGGTRELDAFLGFDRAQGLPDFLDALRRFDLGSQNFCYADDGGTIGYFTYSAVPVREDLQQGTVAGAPPWLIRDGTGGNEWLPVTHPQPQQVVPFEVLPLEEMPRSVNPPAGFLINANNDPDAFTFGNDPLARLRPGGGILYLAPGYDAGFRAGRITRRVREVLARGRMSFEAMQSIQADVKLLDAAFFVPFLRSALERARRPGAPPALAALGADPGVAEAVGRLAAWDGSTPTGIPEGYDAADVDGRLSPPAPAEVQASVAATLYAAWRGRFIVNVIDARLGPLPLPPDQQAMTALQHLLEGFPERHGVGASGIDFFAVPGLDAGPEDRRDLLLLRSVADALTLLASPAFDAAFHGSTRQADYRWGLLHRIVFAHPMDGPFSIPPALGAFPAPLPGLRGIPTDGGFGTVDAASHPARAATPDGFMFNHGPSNRLVVELARGPRKRAESAWPGGVSAVPGTPGYLDLLPLWLTNDTVPLLFTDGELLRGASTVEVYRP